MTRTPADNGGFQRPALDLIADINRGRTAEELTEKIHDLITAVMDTGKKGALALNLAFDPDGKVGDEETPRIKVSASIAVKAPARAVRPSIFYLSDDGNLQRTDPNQLTFSGMRDVSDPDTDDNARTTRKAN